MNRYFIPIFWLLPMILLFPQEKPELRLNRYNQGGDIYFSPDKKYFISQSYTDLFLYETRSLKLLKSISKKQTGSCSGFVSNRNILCGKYIIDVNLSGVAVDSVEGTHFSVHSYSSGSLIISTDTSGTVRVMEYKESLKKRAEITDERISKNIDILDLSEDGRYLLLSTDELRAQVHALIVLDIHSKSIISINRVEHTIGFACFSDLNTVIYSDFYSIFVIDTKTGKYLNLVTDITVGMAEDNYLKLCFASKHKVVASPFTDGTVKIWDVYSGKIIQSFAKKDYYPEGVYLTKDAKHLITMTPSEFPVIWDISTKKNIQLSHPHLRPKGFNRIESIDDNSSLYMALTESGSMLLFDLTGKVYSSIEGKAFMDPFLVQVENNYLKTCDDYITKIRDLRDGKIKLTKKDGFFCGYLYDKFLVTGSDSFYNVWDLPTGKSITSVTTANLNSIILGESILSVRFTANNEFEVWDELNSSRVATFSPDLEIKSRFWNGEVFGSTGSNNEDIIITQFRVMEYSDSTRQEKKSDRLIITVFELNANRKIFEFSRNTKDEFFTDLICNKWITPHLSNDSKILVLCSPEGKLEVYNTESKQLLYEKTLDNCSNPVGVTQDNKYLVVKTVDAVIYYNLASGTHYKTIAPNKILSINNAVMSNDGLKVLTDVNGLVGEKPLRLFDVTTNKVISGIERISGTYKVSFENDLIVFSLTDGCVFYRLSTGEELIRLYEIGDDWAVTSPGGLFDASPGAMEQMYYVQGLDIIEFVQLKDKYWEPGLYGKVMKNEQLRDVDLIDKKLDLWPEITELLFRENYEKLRISLEDRGGGIGRVQIFLNGKEIIEDARDKSSVSGMKSDQITISLKAHPFLKNGVNKIEVVTWNSAGTLSSKREPAEFFVEKKSGPPSIYLIAIGVSDYEGNKIDLKFAAKDASDFLTAARIGAKNLFTEKRTHSWLLNTDKGNTLQPTKSNIIKTFQEVARFAKPEDVIVVYFSGHGLNVGGENGDLHYLTKDAFSPNPDVYKDPAVKASCTLSGEEMVRLLNDIPATKQVLIIDACSAGKLVDNLIVKRDIESSIVKALERMKDRTGLHIITGSAADAVSYEASKFGQGLLTYSILAGMRGLALKENKMVDVAMLMQHSREMVPRLAEGIGGIQEPRIFSPTGAESFDIGIITDQEKMMIPLAKEKKIFISSALQEVNELADILNIGDLIDEQLVKISETIKNAPIVFWAVKTYPEALRISGNYKVTGDNIVVNFKLIRDKADVKKFTVSGLKNRLQELVEEIVRMVIQEQ